jgi:F-type H+-transporting ATPase subunit b
MSLLTPNFGLLFWMLLSFFIVFFIVAKYGFPVIINMVNERKEYIVQTIAKADEAKLTSEINRKKSEELFDETCKRQQEMIKDATVEANRILQKAKTDAAAHSKQKLEETGRLLEMQKQKAVGEIRTQVALLSVSIAEKILRNRLENKDIRDQLISQFLDEIENSDTVKN